MSPADSPFAQLPAPGPHPATAELRAYAAGSLGSDDEHRIETHILDCERCADVVAGFAMSDQATTDRAVADLRTRLQARVGPAEPVPVAGGWAWPRLAAAAALLGAVAGGIWSWEHYAPAPTTARLETAAPSPPVPDAATDEKAPPAQTPEIAAAEAPAAPTVAPATDALTAATMPASIPPADYAAVTPTPAQRRRAFGQAARPATASADRLSMDRGESEVAANEAAAPTADMLLPVAAPAATSAAGFPPPSAPVLAETTTADTLARDDAAKTNQQFAKAKSSINNLAAENSARVAATPMPTAPAIKPAPMGGTPAFREYLRREAAGFLPENGASHLSGLVRLQFTVGADGKLNNLKVLRGLRADYDAEALRMVCEGPAWQPGIAGGRRAPLTVETTVAF